MLDKIIYAIHPEGWRFVGIFTAITGAFWLFLPSLFGLGVILTLWCAYFFRDPKRVTPQDSDLVVSPADGRVVNIQKIVPPAELDLSTSELYKVSIFLNVFDVHINRSPVAGVIKRIIYYPGKFLNASLDKASEYNERNALVIQTVSGKKIGVTQIAGLIARRIVSFVNQEDTIDAGERFGLIRFGSRVDIYLPEGVTPQVIKGQYMIGGESIIANLSTHDDALREGKIQ